MNQTMKTKVELQGDRELVMSRLFDAPRELVFKAYTEAERLKQWWGPRPFPTTYCTVDLRVGGIWHYCMTGPNGEQSWGRSEYREIVPPEKLVYTDAFSDAEGNINSPETIITVYFEDQGGKTLIRSIAVFASAEERQNVLNMGMIAGMDETLDRLDEYLATA